MTQPHNTRRTLLAAVIGLALPVGAAHAVEFLGNKADTSRMMDPTLDTSEYRKIEFLGNTFLASRPAAEGPVRTETMNDPAEWSEHHAQKLEFLGNEFWVQKPSETRY
jgi:hypothetical protein